MAKPIVEMEVEDVVLETPDTKTIRLRWPDGYDVPFQTGQFITLYWPDTPEYKRAYSLSSCALDRGFYEISVRRDGKMGTRLVDWIRPGDRLMVIPPVGRFVPVFEPDKHLVCAAGGSGVAPFRGFVREATRRKLPTRITVLYSVRTPRDIVFEKEFRVLETQNPHFRFKVTCTRVGEQDGWPGRRGRVDLAWLKEHMDDPAQTIFYACGPTAFVEHVEKLVLEGLGLPKGQMKCEKWG